jgi:hypothetical protein
MSDKDYKQKDSNKKIEATTQEKEVLRDEVVLTFMKSVAGLIKEKNEVTSTDEQLLKLEKIYKETREKLKGPQKNTGATAPCKKKE